MSDDLVKRWRQGVMCGDDPIVEEAADRIEQLESSSEGWKEIADEYFDAIGERNTRIKELEAALREIDTIAINHTKGGIGKAQSIARKALEGKDG